MPEVVEAADKDHLSPTVRASEWLVAKRRNAAANANIDSGLASICHDRQLAFAFRPICREIHEQINQDHFDQRVL
jgi:hypothetical protein